MKSININNLPDEVVANLAEKIENLSTNIQEYLTLKDLVVDDNNYYYPIYDVKGELDSYQVLASKQQILAEEFDVTL